MRVVVASRSVPPDVGGYQRQLSILLPILSGHGLEVEAVGAVRSRPPPGSQPGWKGIATVAIPAWRLPRPLRGAADVAVVTMTLIRGIRQRWKGPVALMLLSPTMVGAGVLIALWSIGVGRVVVRFPGAGDVVRLSRRRSSCLWRRDSVRLVVVSRQQRQEAEEEGLTGVVLVPNAVENCPAWPDRQRPPHFVFVGRLIASKGVNTLLDAWAGIHEAVPDWELQIVGSGRGERNGVDDEIAARSARQPRVRLVGGVADARPYLAPPVALVHPSVREGLPNAVLEAMAAGAPVVAASAAMRQWFDGSPPFIAWDGVSPSTLGSTMLKAARAPDLRARVGAAGQAYVRSAHAPAEVASRYARLLRD